jgi:tellurite resistance protein
MALDYTSKDRLARALYDTLGSIPTFDTEQLEREAQAVLIIVGADGVVSEEEWDAFEDLCHALSLTGELISRLARFDWKGSRLEERLAGLPPGAAKRILYFAVRVASADGYQPEERDLVRKAAGKLDVPEETVAAIERIVEAETDLRRTKAALFGT